MTPKNPRNESYLSQIYKCFPISCPVSTLDATIFMMAKKQCWSQIQRSRGPKKGYSYCSYCNCQLSVPRGGANFKLREQITGNQLSSIKNLLCSCLSIRRFFFRARARFKNVCFRIFSECFSQKLWEVEKRWNAFMYSSFWTQFFWSQKISWKF